MKKNTLITVNYKNQANTEKYVQSVNACHNSNSLSIIIVDNESSVQSRADLLEVKKNSHVPITIIPSEKNLFYWGGAALAVSQISFTNADAPDWILVTNNDIVFHKKDFFTRLLKMDIHKQGVIAPKIILKESGVNQNPHLMSKISQFQKLFYQLYFINHKTAKTVHKIGHLIKNIILTETDYEEHNEIDIYAPHGSCVIFSKRFFEMGGYLDDGFSLYGEELSVAEIARELKLRIVYCPQLEVIHNEHSSTSNVEWRNTFNQFKESYYYLKNKHSFKT